MHWQMPIHEQLITGKKKRGLQGELTGGDPIPPVPAPWTDLPQQHVTISGE